MKRRSTVNRVRGSGQRLEMGRLHDNLGPARTIIPRCSRLTKTWDGAIVKRSWKRIILLSVAVCVLAPAVSLGVLSALARKPENLGVLDGRLAPCPDSPNCVSTRAEDPVHSIDPIAFDGPADQALARLKQAIATIPRLRIVSERDGYLHAEATSLIFRFVDDVEFLVGGEEKRIHIRSASRVGRSDLGVNRERVEKIRQAFQQASIDQTSPHSGGR
jgi:uncharacterized protein (DUF1499 family)